jgi:hypothetical protein
MLRYLLPLSLLAMITPAYAAWLHACPASTGPGGAIQAEAKASGPDGAALRYVVSDQARVPGCTSVALAPDAQVETLYPLAPGEVPEDVILLHGNVAEGRFAVSEHDLPSSKPRPERPAPMPLHANLLAGMRVRAFGVEERVQATLADGRLRVTCRPGQRAAGAILTGPWYMTRANVRLATTYAAQGGPFTWQVADEARRARDDALDLGPLPVGDQAARLALPSRLDRAGWRQFVLLCPATQATIDIASLALKPIAAPRALSPPGRATWVWRPSDWIDGGPALLAWAQDQDIRTLFITVPLQDGSAVRAPGVLADFVRAAGARGIAVFSVDGDPHMVLADEVPAAVKRVQAYAAYNASQPPEARLRGVQFDVEPYLLPDNVLPPDRRDAAFVDMARALKAAAGPGLRQEFVVPFWWGKNQALLDALAPHADALAVMDYRTDRGQIVDFAIPFLDWAAGHGRQVRIALEAGSIAPEVQRRYVKAASGDLQAVTIGGRQVLALLRQPLAAAGATLYRLQSTRTIDGSATTFHNDKDALLRLLRGLDADFSAWDGYGGIAIHELR